MKFLLSHSNFFIDTRFWLMFVLNIINFNRRPPLGSHQQNSQPGLCDKIGDKIGLLHNNNLQQNEYDDVINDIQAIPLINHNDLQPTEYDDIAHLVNPQINQQPNELDNVIDDIQANPQNNHNDDANQLHNHNNDVILPIPVQKNTRHSCRMVVIVAILLGLMLLTAILIILIWLLTPLFSTKPGN